MHPQFLESYSIHYDVVVDDNKILRIQSISITVKMICIKNFTQEIRDRHLIIKLSVKLLKMPKLVKMKDNFKLQDSILSILW